MRVAELLSDFSSLRPGLCDPKAAIALVSAGSTGGEKDASKTSASASAPSSREPDAEIDRVKDLLDLHANMKQTHTNGVDAELKQARDAVHKVLQAL